MLVSWEMSWSEALGYCRDLYVDLSSVLSLDHNQILAGRLQEQNLEEAWVGLYRKPWRRVDGAAASFSHWAPGEPTDGQADGCVAVYGERWYDKSCDLGLNFVCQRRFTSGCSVSFSSERLMTLVFFWVW